MKPTRADAKLVSELLRSYEADPAAFAKEQDLGTVRVALEQFCHDSQNHVFDPHDASADRTARSTFIKQVERLLGAVGEFAPAVSSPPLPSAQATDAVVETTPRGAVALTAPEVELALRDAVELARGQCSFDQLKHVLDPQRLAGKLALPIDSPELQASISRAGRSKAYASGNPSSPCEARGQKRYLAHAYSGRAAGKIFAEQKITGIEHYQNDTDAEGLPVEVQRDLHYPPLDRPDPHGIRVKWKYHTAAFVIVRVDGRPQLRVDDPALAPGKLLQLDAWLAEFTFRHQGIQLALTTGAQYEAPQSSEQAAAIESEASPAGEGVLTERADKALGKASAIEALREKNDHEP